METLAVEPGNRSAAGLGFSKLAAILALVLLVIGAGVWFAGRGAPTAEFKSAPAFELIDSNGQTFSSTTLRGKVWLASFFFTSCESVCPMVIGKMNTLFETAPHQIHFVSFSVDPANDTPAALKKYAAKFDADTRRWHFLTGEQEKLRTVVSDGFQVSFPTSKAELDTHSLRLVLVDQNGQIRGYFNSTDEEDMSRLRGILEVYRGAL
ncbi:MAG: hypothetical protein RL417_593 [Pseudomonadota bacterium]|jgi:protein SCO1/2